MTGSGGSPRSHLSHSAFGEISERLSNPKLETKIERRETEAGKCPQVDWRRFLEILKLYVQPILIPK